MCACESYKPSKNRVHSDNNNHNLDNSNNNINHNQINIERNQINNNNNNINNNMNHHNLVQNEHLDNINNIQINHNNKNNSTNLNLNINDKDKDIKHNNINNKDKYKDANNEEKEIKQLSEEEFKELEQNGNVCIICLEPYSDTVIKKTLACGHSFCKDCITRSAEINPYCPVCRAEIDYDKEFDGEVKRPGTNLQENIAGIQLTINNNGVQRSYVYNNNDGSWNIQTLRNIFSTDSHFNRGHHNSNLFATRFGNDRRFIQNRIQNPFFNFFNDNRNSNNYNSGYRGFDNFGNNQSSGRNFLGGFFGNAFTNKGSMSGGNGFSFRF